MDLGAVSIVIGAVLFLSSIVVALSNRQVRQERIEHLEGMNTALRNEIAEERTECSRSISTLTAQVANLQGQFDVVRGDMIKKMGDDIATVIVDDLREWLRT